MKTNTFYSRAIKYFKAGCLVLAVISFGMSTTNAGSADGLVVAHLQMVQTSDTEYDFRGFIINLSGSDFNGPLTLVSQMKDKRIEHLFPNVTLASGDSLFFEGSIFQVITKDARGNLWKKNWDGACYETNYSSPPNTKENNKYETVYFCAWISENSNQSQKDCTFSVELDEFYKDGRKSRANITKEPKDAEFVANEDLSFKVYPNPIVNITYILVNSCQSRNIKLQILNNLGQVVSQSEKYAPEGSEFIEVDMNEYGPGVYFFKIFDNDNSIVSSSFKAVK